MLNHNHFTPFLNSCSCRCQRSSSSDLPSQHTLQSAPQPKSWGRNASMAQNCWRKESMATECHQQLMLNMSQQLVDRKKIEPPDSFFSFDMTKCDKRCGQNLAKQHYQICNRTNSFALNWLPESLRTVTPTPEQDQCTKHHPRIELAPWWRA